MARGPAVGNEEGTGQRLPCSGVQRPVVRAAKSSKDGPIPAISQSIGQITWLPVVTRTGTLDPTNSPWMSVWGCTDSRSTTFPQCFAIRQRPLASPLARFHFLWCIPRRGRATTGRSLRHRSTNALDKPVSRKSQNWRFIHAFRRPTLPPASIAGDEDCAIRSGLSYRVVKKAGLHMACLSLKCLPA
jgi:hypothetical protein